MSLTAAQPAAGPACTAAVITTSEGPVCGLTVEVGDVGVAAYLGIPYGADTGGENRFAPPRPSPQREVLFEATQPGNACPQLGLSSNEDGPGVPESEDCLVVNVWTPNDQRAPLPVLVFIHGGGFLVGTATDTLAADDVDWYNIDGRFLAAEQNLVVVSFNYRLGAFGFLGGLPNLQGNVGLLDQQLALRWVQENIAQFGGNPDNVTLMGESAGGTSVALHTFSVPSSEELFRRAIIESNPAGFGLYNQKQARAQAEGFLWDAGCLFSGDRLGCLRSKSMAELIEAQSLNVSLLTLLDRGLFTIVAWLPLVDGDLVVRQPLIGALDGESDKPLLIGNNDDEAFSFLGQLVSDDINPLLSGAAYEVIFRDSVWEIMERDYLAGATDVPVALLDAAGDYVFMCPAELASLAAPQGYHFRFSHVPQYVGGMTGGVNCSERVCHAVELPYVFGTGRFPGGFSDGDRAVSDHLMGLWGAFAHGVGDAGTSFNGWPLASAPDGGGSSAATLVIGEESSMQAFDTSRCQPWERL